MQENSKRKRGAIIAAGVIVIFLSLLIGLFILLFIGLEEKVASGILLVYIVVEALVVVGVLISLFQRLKEIDKNEIEKAKKY
ncbi:MAG: hypothetical protein PUE18_02465 [Firmicutes bacterium]|nr:hypothetical protein [Bacillota bacterium]